MAEIYKRIYSGKSDDRRFLLKHDQLRQQMHRGHVFRGWSEGWQSRRGRLRVPAQLSACPPTCPPCMRAVECVAGGTEGGDCLPAFHGVFAAQNSGGAVCQAARYGAAPSWTVRSVLPHSGRIRFDPTYKYIKRSLQYDIESTRAPAWCDRVLWRIAGRPDCGLIVQPN